MDAEKIVDKIIDRVHKGELKEEQPPYDDIEEKEMSISEHLESFSNTINFISKIIHL